MFVDFRLRRKSWLSRRLPDAMSRVAWFNGSFSDARMPPCGVHVRYISVVVETVLSVQQKKYGYHWMNH